MVFNYIKRGAYNSFFYGLSSTIVRTINFLFLPFFLSKLTLEEFGLWDFYQLIFSYSTLLLSSVAATGMIRFYLLYQDDELKKKQAIGNGLLTALVSALAFPFFGLILYRFNLFSFTLEQLLLITLSIALFTLFSLVLAFFRMHEKVVSYLVFFCGQNIIATVVTILGVSLGYRIKSFWYANVFSFCLFIPAFAHLFWKHRAYSFSLLKDQIQYSFPLMVYGFIYTSFLSVDRLLIQKMHGFEALGIYALLWRFGALFQFIAIALMDAWPLLIYNAQKEANERVLIGHLMRYFFIVLATMGLYSIIGSYAGIMFFFPQKYRFLVLYLPAFFIPLILLEMGRIFQAGFALSTKTYYIPFLGIITLGIQAFLLYFSTNAHLWGVFFANSIAFFVYGCMSYHVSKKIYKTSFSFYWFLNLLGFFICFAGLMHVCILSTLPFYFHCVLALLWPLALIQMEIITPHEQSVIGSHLRDFTIKLCTKIIPPYLIKPHHLTRIAYLRTDICNDELISGGSVTHTLGVIEGFKKTNAHVVVASSAMPTLLKKTLGNEFTHLRAPQLFIFLRWKLGYLRWRLDCFFSTFTFAFRLRTIIRAQKIEVIYQRYSLLNATGALLSAFYRIPLILEYNGSEVWQFDQLAPKKWFKFNWLAQLVENVNIHYAQSIIVVSQPLKDDLVSKNIDASKILVNPNGVNTELYNPALLCTVREKIRTQLIIQDKFVIGFIGTFSFWHGIETLASIIPEVAKRCPHVHFLLIGDGILKSYFMREVERTGNTHCATLTGLVPTYLAREYLAACDAFICPTKPNSDGSRFFGSPTKLFEYLSMAKPIIASRLEQLTEIVAPAVLHTELPLLENSDECIGVLVEPNNIEGFVDAVCSVATLSAKQQTAVGNRARLKAQHYYSWDQHVKKIEQFTLRNVF